MALPRSAVPQRIPAGTTSDPPYGPLADCGMGNPFFYHQFEDDFDNTLGATGLYTVNKGSTGTAVHTAGDGGLITLTTAATNNDYVGIEVPVADYTLPQGAGAGKKLFFLARVQMSDVVNSALILGLCNATATPFASVTDGVYFTTAAGVLNIVTNVGGASVVTPIPASAYSLVNATNIDLAYYIDWYGNVNVFVGAQLVGFIPQSGTGAVNSAGVPTLPVVGRCLQLTTPNLTAVNLTPTMAIKATAAAAKALTADFWCVEKER